MSIYTKIFLSGSTNGRPKKITSTTSGGADTIHTATAIAVEIDEVWLWVNNSSAAVASLSLMWGGTTDPDDYICKDYPIEPNSDPVLIVPGFDLAGGLLVKAFGSVANVLNITGYVNRITQ